MTPLCFRSKQTCVAGCAGAVLLACALATPRRCCHSADAAPSHPQPFGRLRAWAFCSHLHRLAGYKARPMPLQVAVPLQPSLSLSCGERRLRVHATIVPRTETPSWLLRTPHAPRCPGASGHHSRWHHACGYLESGHVQRRVDGAAVLTGLPRFGTTAKMTQVAVCPAVCQACGCPTSTPARQTPRMHNACL